MSGEHEMEQDFVDEDADGTPKAPLAVTALTPPHGVALSVLWWVESDEDAG